jgi:hypothetical protein
MKIELVCQICKKSLATKEIPPIDCMLFPNACIQIDSPFCKECANKYMYSGGTMKLEQQSIEEAMCRTSAYWERRYEAFNRKRKNDRT